MATGIFFADAADDDIYGSNATYLIARAGTGSLATQLDGANALDAGQLFSTPTYRVVEGFVSFDTSSLPDTETVTSATLSLYLNNDRSLDDFTCNARLYDWSTTVTTADFIPGANLAALPLLAHVSSVGITAGVYVDFVDDAMAANVNRTGFTRMVLCSSRTEAATVPTQNEYLQWINATNTGTTFDPRLTVIYAKATTIAVRAVSVANTGITDAAGNVGLTVNVPAGTQNGDMLYLAIHAASSTGVFVTPAGWTVVEAQFSSTGQASSIKAVYRRVASSEPGSYTITWGLAAATGRAAAIMVALTGVNTEVPQQAEAKDAGAGPTTTEVLPSVTTTSQTMLLGFVGAYTPAFGATTWTPDPLMTELADTSSANTTKSNASMQLVTDVVVAGASGTRTSTGSRADLRPSGVMVALNPAIPRSQSVVVA